MYIVQTESIKVYRYIYVYIDMIECCTHIICHEYPWIIWIYLHMFIDYKCAIGLSHESKHAPRQNDLSQPQDMNLREYRYILESLREASLGLSQVFRGNGMTSVDGRWQPKKGGLHGVLKDALSLWVMNYIELHHLPYSYSFSNVINGIT